LGAGEQCDDGTPLCTSGGPSNGEECGTVAGKAACDTDGGTCPSLSNNNWAADACRTNCLSAFCGDGVADAHGGL